MYVSFSQNEAFTSYREKSTSYLLALILGDVDVAFRVEKLLSESVTIPTVEQLTKIRGVGLAMARKVLACCEMSARYIVGENAESVTEPEYIGRLLASLKYENQEHFVCVTLDSQNHIIDKHVLTTGLVNQTPVHPREAFREALKDNAVSVIFAHNHPSGSLNPSPEDINITRVLIAAGKILQIPVLDHVILGKTGVHSLCREYPEMFEGKFNNKNQV